MHGPAFFVALALAAVEVSANCIHGTHLHRRQVDGEGRVEVSNFGYTGEQGPLNWAALDPANSACRSSKVQSPIVLDNTIEKAAEAPVVVIENVEEAEFENLGTTLETIVTGTTTFAGVEFTLQQFHLHTPSEHRINEEYFPLEMHMVHEAADGSIAVIAIPFQLTEDGSTTELLTSVITNIADVAEPGSVTKTGPLDFAPLIDAIQTKPLFQYTGSLTTPPCAEGLTFLVMEEPLPLNVATYNTLKSVIKFNARYSQNTLGTNNLLQVATDLAIKEDGAALCANVEGLPATATAGQTEAAPTSPARTATGEAARETAAKEADKEAAAKEADARKAAQDAAARKAAQDAATRKAAQDAAGRKAEREGAVRVAEHERPQANREANREAAQGGRRVIVIPADRAGDASSVHEAVREAVRQSEGSHDAVRKTEYTHRSRRNVKVARRDANGTSNAKRSLWSRRV